MHLDVISCQMSHLGAFNSPLITRMAQIPTDFSESRPPNPLDRRHPRGV